MTIVYWPSPGHSMCTPFGQWGLYWGNYTTVTHSQIWHYFISYLLTCEVDLFEVLDIMAQMWCYIFFFGHKPTKVTSDCILNYLKKLFWKTVRKQAFFMIAQELERFIFEKKLKFFDTPGSPRGTSIVIWTKIVPNQLCVTDLITK